MAALTAERNTVFYTGDEVEYEVAAAAVIFDGALVSLDATGYLIAGADTASTVFAGVAMSSYDNTAGADGAATVIVRRMGVHKFATAETLTRAHIGTDMYITDDQTVDFVGTTTNDIYCGKLAWWTAAGIAYLDISAATRGKA